MSNSKHQIRTAKRPLQGLCMLITFCLIYTSNDTILFGTNSDTRYLLVGYVALAIMIIVMLTLVLKETLAVNRRVLMACLAMISISRLSGWVNSDFNNKYVYEALLIIAACLYVTCFSANMFRISYIKCLVFFAACSLVIYSIKTVAPALITLFPTVYIKTGLGFWNTFVGVVPQMDFIAFRNYSIFREPGVYQAFLTIALVLLVFKETEFRNRRLCIAILGLAMLLTFSTAGYVVIGVMLGVYIISISERKITHVHLLLLMGVIFVFVFALSSGLLSLDFVLYKIGNTNHPSWIARTGSIVGNCWIAITHPIVGAGWDNAQALFNNFILEWNGSSVFDNTNTFLKELSMHGFVFFSIWAFGFWKFIARLSDSSSVRIGVLLILFLTLSNGDLTLNVLPLLLVYYGIANTAVEKAATKALPINGKLLPTQKSLS